MLFAALALARLHELTDTAMLPPGSTITILDGSGRHLAGPALEDGPAAPTGAPTDQSGARLLDTLPADVTARWRGSDGVERIFARVPLDAAGYSPTRPRSSWEFRSRR